MSERVVTADVHFYCPNCGMRPTEFCNNMQMQVSIVASKDDWESKMNRQLGVCHWCKSRFCIEARVIEVKG